MKSVSKLIIIPLFVSLVSGTTFIVYGEFYRYTDKSGKTRYVDDMVKVPMEYRGQLKTYQEPRDYLSEEEKNELRKKEDLQEEMSTHVAITNNNVIIPVKISNNGKEIEAFLVLDTGASITTLHRDVASQLDLKNMRKGKARIVGGEEITFDITHLDSVKVGPFEKNNLLVGIVDYRGGLSHHNGLLGMNFLQHYEYIIDYENQMVRWHPQETNP